MSSSISFWRAAAACLCLAAGVTAASSPAATASAVTSGETAVAAHVHPSNLNWDFAPAYTANLNWD
ncbi:MULTISPECIES: hypothetical protein [Streptomyces]|uniref:hypothetical protein n=1 Tax=Streptomyces TaxID=1883 RepID=UPI001924F5D7|nr:MULTISPECIES: hypothetical protein [Streptomyces]MCM9080915.1 hypothetical protein [Streptomyces spororaveus]MCX5304638.1 hypothetical protein [Streptomyces sp. NBC_00160]